MRKRSTHIPVYAYALVVFTAIATGCSTTKSIPDGDYLYKGVKWETKGPKIPKDIRSEMEKIPRPKPNSSVLGMPYKLWLYNAIAEPKKKKGLGYRMKYKWGEAPVLLSQVRPAAMETRISGYLFEYGYFRSELKHDTLLKQKTAYVKYSVTPGTRYMIRDVHFPGDSSQLSACIREAAEKTLLKKGAHVELKTLEDERERIDEDVKNKGYFFYAPDFILYKIDTLHQGQADIYFTLKDDMPERSSAPWDIGNISIYGNYTLSRDSIITKEKGKREKVFTVIDNRERYNTSVYERALLIKENSLYSKRLHYLSIERLMNLNTFRFVKMMFIPDTSAGKKALDTRVYITPMKKNTLRFEASAYTKTGNYVGSELGFKWRNVNVFKGAEVMDFKVSGSFDAQVGGKETQSPNAYTLASGLTFYIPRIIPYFKVVTGRNSFMPRTGISLSAEYLKRPELYTQRTVGISMDYTWKYRNTTEHVLRPIRIQSIDPSNTTPKFDSILAEDVSLRASFEKQLIIGSQYQYTYNNTFRTHKRFTEFIRLNVGTSGNIFSLLSHPAVDTPGAKQFLNIPVSQYIRLEADLRGYWRLSDKWSVANRFIAGSAFAYGNSRIAPYSEQFFIGGSSSVRAFRIRTLGPGSYHTAASEYQANESGEIKLEMNSEMRYTLGKYLRFAGFVDAGNIWLSKETPDKPGSAFTKDFYKQIAVGAGMGIRLDFSIMILRFDFATPLRKPWLPEGQRWVITDINLGSSQWRKENILLNIGIGYPF